MRSSQMRSDFMLMLTVELLLLSKIVCFFMSFILCENCEFVKWMCWMLAFFV